MNLARNIGTTLLARIAVLGIALVSSVVLARLLGPEARGTFALVLILPEFAMTFGLLGFEQSNAVYAGIEPKARAALVWQSILVATVAGTIVVGAGASFLALGAPGFESLLRAPLWMYLVPLAAVPARLVARFWSALLRGMNHIATVNLFEVGTKVLSLVLVVAFVAGLRWGVTGAVWADWVFNVAAAMSLAALLRSAGAWGRPAFDWCLLRRTGRYALPAYCSSFLSYLNYRVDELLVALLLPPEQLGFYVIAVGLAERIWTPTGAVAMALLPHLANTKQRDPALTAVIARHVMLWTGAGCLLVLALGRMAVRLLYSTAYEPAVAPLCWLLPGILTLSVAKILVAELSAREKINYTVWVGAVTVAVNIGGNLLLIPRMGISGAALASTVSYSLLSLMVSWYYVRETRVPWTQLVPRMSDVEVYLRFMGWRRAEPAPESLERAPVRA